MNKLLVLFAGVLMSTSSFAMSGSYGVSTDYMWRGQTQTDHGMHANLSLKQDLGGGFYGGAWTGNVEVNGTQELEMDFYGGFTKMKGDFWVDAKYVAYRYTGETVTDFEERIVSVGYNAFSYGKAHGIEEALNYEWYELKLPFIKWADVTLHSGEWENGLDNKSVKLNWSLTDDLTLGMMVMSHIRDDNMRTGDAISFHLKSKF